MNRFAAVAALAVALAWGALPSLAAGDQWRVRVDTEASAIRFTLGATLHTVRGTAGWAGAEQELRVDPATGAVTGKLVVDAGSLDTGNRRRDRKMHRDVLESERFPEIAFVAESLDGPLPLPGSEGRFELVGRLEIHGREMPLALPVAVRFTGGGGWTAEAAFDVPYVELGMDDPSTLVLRVEKSVRVELELSGAVARSDG